MDRPVTTDAAPDESEVRTPAELPRAYVARFGVTRIVGEFSLKYPQWIPRNASVILRTDRGMEWGTILCPATDRTRSYLGQQQESGRIVRIATPEDEAERNAVMANLSKRYGLFYFFAQSCGACNVMSPILRSVTSNWGMTVRAISTDGGPSAQFPDYIVETSQRAKMGLEPKVTPAVVLWDALKGRPIPIGYGVMSADELQDRIYLLTQKEAGHDY